jgi:hypothetical protein
MVGSTDLERHCTLVYGVARPDTRGIDLTLSLAGHHPPLVLRQRDGRRSVEPVGTFGTALGLIEEPELFDSTTRLEPGDMMCLFTDGLVEARHGAALFGSEGVTRVMLSGTADSPEELAGALVAAARAFHQGPQLSDDLAILVLRAQLPALGGPQGEARDELRVQGERIDGNRERRDHRPGSDGVVRPAGDRKLVEALDGPGRVRTRTSD